MKQIKQNELIEGRIYSSKSSWCDSTELFIWKCDKNGKLFYSHRLWSRDKISGIFSLNGTHNWTNIFEATPEEKHWLETCIKADKFVSYEEAMKTFIPEYVECIKIDCELELNTIYKVINSDKWSIPSNGNPYVVYLDSQNLKGATGPFYLTYFKPSTKEAYDAQFVVKKPEFVLPEKWAIIITNENKDIVNKYRKSIFNNSNISCNLDVNNVHLSDRYDGTYYHYNKYYFKEHTNCEEITTEQFKQYVLKENTTVTEKPKVVLEEPKDKVLQLNQLRGKGTTIVQVECSEGGVYKISDKIRIFGGSKNPVFRNKQYFTIQSFRWSNDKSKICAVFNTKFPNGIGLDKIELYVEPKVKQELSLLEQAKLKYPVGTKFRVAHLPHIICKVKDHENYYFQTDEIINLNIEVPIDGCFGGCVYYKGKWAEIVDDFVLPEKWCIKSGENLVLDYCNKNGVSSYSKSELQANYAHFPSHDDCTTCSFIFKDYTEITFEQFKKYVLKDE